MELTIAAVIGLILLFIIYRIFKTFVKWLFLLILGLAIVGYFTNPDEQAHHASLSEETKALGIKRIRKKDIQVDDYKVLSVTKVKAGTGESIVGIAAFGRIWYPGDLERKLKRN
jgi:hypothetical protein